MCLLNKVEIILERGCHLIPPLSTPISVITMPIFLIVPFFCLYPPRTT